MAQRPSQRLGVFLVALFALALLMGPGPGVALINPSGPGDDPLLWGVPKLYLWGLLWCSVQAGVVAAAARWLWKGRDE
ncbi:MAG: hypothetical protein O2816_00705 [Planctomycetota bacterium]|nr:hypothetical protein [Planctomycetota bacterium]